MSSEIIYQVPIQASGETHYLTSYGLFVHVKGGSTSPMWTTTFKMPSKALNTCTSCVLYWDGVGTLSFAIYDAGDTINGGAGPVSFVGDAVASPAFLFVVYSNGVGIVKAVSARNHGVAISAVAPNIQLSATDEVDAGHELGDAAIYFADKDSADLPTLNSAADEVVAIGSEVGTNAGVSKVLKDGNVLIGARAGGGATVLAADEICLGNDCGASGVVGRISVQCEGATAEIAANSTHTVPIRLNGTLYRIMLTNA